MHDQNQQPVDERAKSINRKWKAIMLIYTLAAGGLALYWEIPDPGGLNEYVYEAQVAILEDSYYPVLDILLTMLALLIPMYFVKLIVEKATGVKIDNPNYRR